MRGPGGGCSEKVTSTARPPPGRARAPMVAPWAAAMALTMDRPRPWPWPSRRAGRGPSRSKGWNRRSTSVGGMSWPELVTDRTAPTAGGPGGDLDVPAGDVVPDGVVDQVGHQLLDQERVTFEDGGPEVGVDIQAEAADPGAGNGQRGAGDGRQVEGLVLAGAGFAAGQGEQRLDEAFLLGVGGEQLPADGLPGAGGAAWVGEGYLEQGAFPGQGRAQLVRGIGGEAPLGVERGLQPREQVVEGVGEFLELVVGSVQAQPLVQAAGGDPPGGGGDRAQRAQHPAGDDPADRGGGHRDGGQGDGADDQDFPLVVVDVKLRIGKQLSLLSGGEGRRPLKLPGGGDGHRGVDDVVAACLLDVGDGDPDGDFDDVVAACLLDVGDGDLVVEYCGGGSSSAGWTAVASSCAHRAGRQRRRARPRRRPGRPRRTGR